MRIRPTSAFAAAVYLTCLVTGASAQEACPANLGALDVGGWLACLCTAEQVSSGGVYGNVGTVGRLTTHQLATGQTIGPFICFFF